MKPSVSKKNKDYIKSLPCLATGHPATDPAHFPLRRSQGGVDSLLNLIPLRRDWHRKTDDYVEPFRSMSKELALEFHKRLYDSGQFSDERLGERYWDEQD